MPLEYRIFCVSLHNKNKTETSEMKISLRFALIMLTSLFCFQCFAQNQNWREKYQVKKKDTLYGIAKKYNISVDALIEANPEMKVDGFELKKI